MKNQQTKLWLFAMLLILTQSCDESMSDIQDQKNRMLSFASEDAFFDQVRQLDTMNDADLEMWKRSNYDFVTLLEEVQNKSEVAEEYADLPTSYKLILNNEGVVKVGNLIVLYKNGGKYGLPVDQYDYRLDYSQIMKNGMQIGEYGFQTKSEGTSENGRTRIRINGGLDASWQREFYFFGNLRKYVHELVSFYDVFNSGNSGCGTSIGNARIRLYLRIKLEWKGRRGWRPAGEHRNISWNLSSNVNLNDISLPCTGFFSTPYFASTLSNSNKVTKSDEYLLLGEYQAFLDHSASLYSGYWNAEVSGTISHKCVDDPDSNNLWNNSGYPLW